MDNSENSISRRRLLQAFGMGALALGAGSALAACSGGSTVSPTGSASPTGSPRKGGNLRVGLGAGAPTETLDPYSMAVYPDWCHAFMLYDLLAYPNPSTFELENHLAESMTPNAKGDVWTVKLKSGVEFHNGKTLTADDLIASVQRILKGYVASSLYFVDPKGLKKLDAQTVEFTLNTPYSMFPAAFAGSNQFITPVDFDPSKPVGTGPFKLVSFKPGDQAVFAANPNYWGQVPYVDQVTTIDITDDTARMNALLGGQIDIAQGVPYDQVATLAGNSAVSLLESETVAWVPFVMRIDAKPFDDVRVRQAFRLIANRDQLVAQAFLGHGKVANDLFMQYDPVYIGNKLPQRAQNIEQAKSLLAEAGQSGMTTEMVVANLAPGIVAGAQAFVQMAQQAGVTINLRTVQAGDFYGPDYLSYPLTVDLNISTTSYLTTCGLWTAPNAPYNSTHMDKDTEYTELYYKACATMDDTARAEICGQMQQIEYDRGGYINYGWGNVIDAYSSKLAGQVTDKMGWPMTSYGFNRVWFTS
jgi:peptide/nickel transport system substrate-binding protein